MIPSFGIFADELEDMGIWVDKLTTPSDRDKYKLHIIVILQDEDILGAAAVEFYPKSGCALLTYIVTNPKHRSQGLSKVLVENALQVVNEEAKNHDQLFCKALFMETNDDQKIIPEKDVMDPKIRQKIFKKIGFSFLEFPYVQPPLGEDKGSCHDLLLGVYNPEAAPSISSATLG